MASDRVKVRFNIEGTIAFANGTAFSHGEEAEISRKDALALAKKGKCEILVPERRTAAKKKAPVTR